MNYYCIFRFSISLFFALHMLHFCQKMSKPFFSKKMNKINAMVLGLLLSFPLSSWCTNNDAFVWTLYACMLSSPTIIIKRNFIIFFNLHFICAHMMTISFSFNCATFQSSVLILPIQASMVYALLLNLWGNLCWLIVWQGCSIFRYLGFDSCNRSKPIST